MEGNRNVKNGREFTINTKGENMAITHAERTQYGENGAEGERMTEGDSECKKYGEKTSLENGRTEDGKGMI